MCLILPFAIPKCISPGVVINSHRWLTENNGALCPSRDFQEGNKNNGEQFFHEKASGWESVTRCGKMLLNLRHVVYKLYDNHHTTG